jgi:cytochrome b6-f complex iron-sulfur subunit
VKQSRRNFLTWLWVGLGAAVVAEFVWVGLTFLKPRRRPGASEPDLVVCGAVDDFAPGSVTPFPAGAFYLARLEDGGFLALHRECTHLGCTVPWNADENRFVCPCHASTFDLAGRVSGPPAPRPLDLLEVRIENGVVKVVPGRRIRRGEFRPDQVVRA